jgi:cytochrome P450
MSPAAPPVASASWLVGSALELRRNRIGVYERAMREHGDVVRLVVGPPGRRFDLYCVFHPDGVRQVLAGARDRYSKGNRFFQQIGAGLGWGLLTSEGELWRRQRRLIQPLFTLKQVTQYASLMAEEAACVADRWARDAARHGVIDAHADMTRLTLRVLGRAVFGEDVEQGVDVVRRAFPVVTRHIARRVTAPVAAPTSWPTPGNRRAAHARAALDGVVDRMIAQRKQAPTGGEDLLSRLLATRDAQTGEAMDEQQVRDEALIFLLAGHETTSTALTFTLHLLGRHRGEQQRVHEELESVLGGRPPSAEDLSNLPRVAMAIKEAMRLHPPAFALGRMAMVEDEIGGHRIPKGANVVVSQWVTHRHPDFWEAPDVFDPERFTPEREAERHRWAYFPFGSGPRACIGSHFATLEAVIAVAVLLQRFQVHSDHGDVAVDTEGITLRPDGVVPIHLTAR